MLERPSGLTAFLDSLRQCVPAIDDPSAQAMLARVFARLAAVGAPQAGSPRHLAVCDLLEPVLSGLERSQEPLAGLARRLRALAPQLQWSERPGPAPGASADFAGGHANAMIVGPRGIEERRDLWIGISLLAPGVRYPDHDHAPPEVYLVLTPGRFRQADGEWFSPAVGNGFYNPPAIRHAMAAQPDTPLVALWMLDVA